MSDRARLTRIVHSLPDPVLRRDWLRHELERLPAPAMARTLDSILVATEGADPTAWEVALTLAMVVVMPESEPIVRQLRSIAEQEELFSLRRMTRSAPPLNVHAPPAEEAPVPDYGTGRELTLGERRSLARRPDRRRFDQLLSDPHPMVTRLLLDNPKLTEDDVIRLASRRPARREVLTEIARSPRWLSRARVRMTILLNPGSPPALTIPLVAVCTRTELRQVVRGVDASIVLRATAQELLDRRPPVPEAPEHERTLQ